MEYECGPVILYSQDKVRMMDFLCDVFEFDVDAESENINRGPLYLKLAELDSSQTFSGNSGIVFSFKVKSEKELKEIMSKYNFFLYRKADPHGLSEKIDLIEDSNKKILTISDIDQRLWRFEFHLRSAL